MTVPADALAPHLDALRAAVGALRSVADAVRTERADEPAVPAAAPRRALADEMRSALAERDEQFAALQSIADERGAALGQTAQAAEERLAVIERLTGDYQRAAEYAAALEARVTSLSEVNAELQRAAEDRLALIESNERAYAHFRHVIHGRLAELVDMTQ